MNKDLTEKLRENRRKRSEKRIGREKVNDSEKSNVDPVKKYGEKYAEIISRFKEINDEIQRLREDLKKDSKDILDLERKVDDESKKEHQESLNEKIKIAAEERTRNQELRRKRFEELIKEDQKKKVETIKKKISKAVFFSYLIDNKESLIDELRDGNVEYEMTRKKSSDGKYYYDVESSTPVPGHSLTDRVQKLIYYEQKTNTGLMVFKSLTAAERENIKNGGEVNVEIDFGGGRIESVLIDGEKYRKLEFADRLINDIYRDLTDPNLDTNSKLSSKFAEFNDRSFKSQVRENNLSDSTNLSTFMNNLLHIASKWEFQNDDLRFPYYERTATDHRGIEKKQYKLKYGEGFMEVAEGYKFGGKSKPQPVIKRILSPLNEKYREAKYKGGNPFNKYENTWIKKREENGSPTTEVYKAKVLELFGIGNGKIRLQNINRKVEYIKMNENSHMLQSLVTEDKNPNYLDDKKIKNLKINDRDLVKNVLISYLFLIGDRHQGNLLDTLEHIDFGIDRKTVKHGKKFYLGNNLELYADKHFAHNIKDGYFYIVKNELFKYMSDVHYNFFLKEKFNDIKIKDFERYINDALNEIFSKMDRGTLEKLKEINEEYKMDMLKENKYEVPSSLFLVTVIEELFKDKSIA